MPFSGILNFGGRSFFVDVTLIFAHVALIFFISFRLTRAPKPNFFARLRRARIFRVALIFEFQVVFIFYSEIRF